MEGRGGSRVTAQTGGDRKPPTGPVFAETGEPAAGDAAAGPAPEHRKGHGVRPLRPRRLLATAAPALSEGSPGHSSGPHWPGTCNGGEGFTPQAEGDVTPSQGVSLSRVARERPRTGEEEPRQQQAAEHGLVTQAPVGGLARGTRPWDRPQLRPPWVMRSASCCLCSQGQRVEGRAISPRHAAKTPPDVSPSVRRGRADCRGRMALPEHSQGCPP